jgi:hypothetical protein
MAKNAKEADPSPLAMQRVGQQTYVYFPTKYPDDRKDKVLPALSTLMEMCTFAGFHLNGTEKELDNSFWNLLESMSDSIRGAFYFLQRSDSDRAPVDNVPAELKRGWNFAQWYAFSSAAKVSEWNEGYTIPRTTSLQSADKGQWSASKTFSDVDRLNNLVRMCATNCNSAHVPVVKFLKGEGYFTGKFVGKKPVTGLYTETEYQILKQDWEARMVKTKASYKSLSQQTLNSASGPAGLSTQLASMQSAHDAKSKVIEETKSHRIPELLISEGRGRSTKKVIAKGSDLSEKLISIKGGESVRTIAKVLYSPATIAGNMTITDWTSIVMTEARNTNLRNETVWDVIQAKIKAKEFLSSYEDAYVDNYSAISTAIQTYMEIIPDRTGNTAWDTTFGVYKLIK